MATITDLITRGVKNRLVQTQTFSNTVWTHGASVAVTANTAVAPDGTTTAALLNDSSNVLLSNVHRDVPAADPYLTANGLHTFSVYLKQPTSGAAASTRIELLHVASAITVTLDITWATLTLVRGVSGAVGYASHDFRALPNGWYRASVTTKYTASSAMRCRIYPAGSNLADTGGIWAWGAQFEEGAFATSYVPVLTDTDTTVSPTPAGITTVYSTWASWLSAIAADTTNVRIAKLKNETYYVTGGTLTMARTGTNGTTVLTRVEPEGSNYDPVSNTGPKMIIRWPSSGTSWGLKLTESHVEIYGVGFFGDIQARGGSSNITANGSEPQPVGWSQIWIDQADNCTIADCFFSGERGGGDTNAGNDIVMYGAYIGSSAGSGNPAQGNALFNCIFKGGTNNRGFDIGVYFGSFAQYGGVFNCDAYGIDGHNNGFGFYSSNSPLSWTNGAPVPVPAPECINCLALGCGTGFSGIWQTFQYNASSDVANLAYWDPLQQSGGLITGVGTISDTLTNKAFISANSVWLAPDLNDFRLRSGGSAVDAGSNINSKFTATNGPGNSTDIRNATRTASGQKWDMGAYEGSSTFGHPLSGSMVITSTGATSSQNETGDSQIRVSCFASGTLKKGETLTFLTDGGFVTVTVTADVVLTGTTSSADLDNISFSPVLASDAVIGASVVPGQNFVTTTKTVGLSPSRDYGSIGQLFADLPSSLYYTNQRIVATVYDDGEDSLGNTIEAQYWNCITGPSQNIVVAASKNYDPRTTQGPRLKLAQQADAFTHHRAVLWLAMNYVEFTGIRIYQAADSTTTRNARAVEVFANWTTFDACCFLFDGTYARSIGLCYEVEGDNNLVTNCTAIGASTQGQGPQVGFAITQDCRNNQILHSIAYRVRGGTDGQVVGTSSQGFLVRLGAINCRLSGCVAMATATGGTGGASGYGVGSGMVKTQIIDHCFADDTSTGLGDGCKNSLTASQVFNNAAALDFRLVASPLSPAVKAGTNLSTLLSTDVVGARRKAPFDVGIFEGLAYAPLVKAPAPRDHHRFCSLWEINRNDGASFYFTSANEPISHAGKTYLPAGQTQDAAKRMEGALKAHTTDLVGAVSATTIKPEDLAAGIYSGAVITMRKVDWRYPWAVPYETKVWYLSQVEYDEGLWQAELTGLTTPIDQKGGELLGVDCPAQLGDEDCRVDLRSLTQYNISVSSVTDARRTFAGNSMAGTGVSTDDYFALGKVTFLSGLNVGLSFNVKVYTGGTKTIKLMTKTPYDIAVNDKFDLVPGCRKRLKQDCIPKFNNGVNFQGRFGIPGPDTLLDTPTR